MIDDTVLLLERSVVLLVDHDEPERGEGQPERRPRADHHLCPALGDGAPGLAPLPRAELGVPDRRVHAEPCAEAREPLGAQRDLGQHHQHLVASIERGGDGLEIDLGLARAGHAVEDGDRKRRNRKPPLQRLGGLSLRVGQDGTSPARIGATEGRDLPHGDRLNRAEVGQAAHHAGTHTGLAGDFCSGARRPLLQQR